jgi:hypothetical protein
MTNTEELTETIRQQLASGNCIDGYVEVMARAIARIEVGLSSNDGETIDTARSEAIRLLERINELTVLGERRLEGLQTDLAALVRQGSLQKRYGLSPP